MEKNYEKAYALTKKYGQEHLLSFYDELNDDVKAALLEQILNIDFELSCELYKNAGQASDISEGGKVEPIGYKDKALLGEDVLKVYAEKGNALMSDGRFAAVTMAGGQGTRLGHNGPKGTYDIGLPSHESLFAIQCRRLKTQSEKCGKTIPWYIMTSRENDAATKAFFEEHDYFGYDRDYIKFFVQSMLPMIDFDGKIVLESKGKIKEGADGHGGLFSAMIKNGIYDDMKAKGIKWIFVGGIDNVLLKLCDPAFLGFVDESGCGIGAKSLVKRDAREKVGVFCLMDGKPYVIEYTEVSDEMAEARDENGEFLYGDAHILCNMFNISAFEKMTGDFGGLPYHTAIKKTNFVNGDGEIVVPDKPNAYKFEAFIFDAFKYFDSMAILRVERSEEFAPVKNKDGEDSPATARELFMNAVDK
ncbi:MAG: UDPGP type 1 family protein [Ruminococcaceae bacterium]|nr:UDPGP type 1 family protein [Oscillospiraceae bacterium]